ncbi:MAG: dihydrofolate reductase family protein [Anaerolineae bacterium]|nr:dihydrofolate reductase family protein [Anaerolineae bacterium]
MGKVVFGMTISLDGFVNDRNGDVSRLYPDLAALHESELLAESMRTTGAVVMGRHSYDMANGDFTGYEYQVPIFVLTHYVPETVAKGENGNLKFNFVTEGIESAIQQAKAAAGAKDVTMVGGVDAAQQAIEAELVDEIQISIMPILFGEGLRLFEHLGKEVKLEKIKVVDAAERTDLVFRVVK